ncbi:hypothetical protein BDZ89DRAFT_1040214 [Hymenopellis radicata]|nr:hypothetical protein BDZ89DRAFT_1040214 [Hymenopellis radicata]
MCGAMSWANPIPAPVKEFEQPQPPSPSSRSISAPPPLPGPLSPSSPGHAWSFIPQLLEWSAPMAAIQMLSERISPSIVTSPIPLASDYSIHDILLPMQIEQLLGMFYISYVPWLNFIPVRGSLTDVIGCSIAIRHLPSYRTPGARLAKLAEDTVARMMFNPGLFECIETIHGLIMLALWPSSQGDGKVLISMAVNIATNMQLNKAAAHVAVMRKTDGGVLSDELMERAKLWLALTNIESFLCYGSRRRPLSRRSPQDLDLIPLSIASNPAEGRDLRLRITSETLLLVENALSTTCARYTELTQFKTDITLCLSKMDAHLQMVLPLSVIADHDTAHYHLLQCQVLTYRQLVLHHAFFLMQRISQEHPQWFTDVEVRVMVEWAKDAMRTAEALMTTFLHSKENVGETCPDNVYMHLGFSASMIVGMRLLVRERTDMEVRGAWQALLRNTAEVLERTQTQVEGGREHAAVRVARVIRAIRGSWMKKGLDTPFEEESPLLDEEAWERFLAELMQQ